MYLFIYLFIHLLYLFKMNKTLLLHFQNICIYIYSDEHFKAFYVFHFPRHVRCVTPTSRHKGLHGPRAMGNPVALLITAACCILFCLFMKSGNVLFVHQVSVAEQFLTCLLVTVGCSNWAFQSKHCTTQRDFCWFTKSQIMKFPSTNQQIILYIYIYIYI